MSLFDVREFVDEQNDILNELSDETMAKFDPRLHDYTVDDPNDFFRKVQKKRNNRWNELFIKLDQGTITDQELKELDRINFKNNYGKHKKIFEKRFIKMDGDKAYYRHFEDPEPKKETNIPKQDEQKSQSTPKNPTPKGNSGGGGTSKKKSSPSTSSTPDSQPSWLSRNKYKAGAGALVGAAAGYGIYKKRHAIKNKLSNLWNRIRGRKQY